MASPTLQSRPWNGSGITRHMQSQRACTKHVNQSLAIHNRRLLGLVGFRIVYDLQTAIKDY